MPLQVCTADGKILPISSAQDFEQIFSLPFLASVAFAKPSFSHKIKRKITKALKREWITSRQKWLGYYHAPGLEGKVPLDLTIAWISSEMGYGVFTNREIPANAFIGEYTGILRKRRFWKRWSNLYCFDYNIGEGRNSGFIIDAQDCGNHTRFINHSSTHPNLEPVSVYWAGKIYVLLHAIRKIAAGEQLFYDYGEDYWKKRGKPLENTDFPLANLISR